VFVHVKLLPNNSQQLEFRCLRCRSADCFGLAISVDYLPLNYISVTFPNQTIIKCLQSKKVRKWIIRSLIVCDDVVSQYVQSRSVRDTSQRSLLFINSIIPTSFPGSSLFLPRERKREDPGYEVVLILAANLVTVFMYVYLRFHWFCNRTL